MRRLAGWAIGLLWLLAAGTAFGTTEGYYRQPAPGDGILVFVAEGDLWKVAAEGGVATRLTSHPGTELHPAVSPDGSRVAFVGRYEGPSEIYTMSITGGTPTRWTYGAAAVEVVGWANPGHVLFSSNVQSTLPNRQVFSLDVTDPSQAGRFTPIPLAQAANGDYADDGRFAFTRFAFNGSHTKRYQGGTAQDVWRFDGEGEAVNLTGDHPGTDRDPWWWNDRIVYASDRDGTINLWSMNADGGDRRQLTEHSGWDVKDPHFRDGVVAYQLGADLRVLDLASGDDGDVSVTLDSDLDHRREHWVHNPLDYLSSVHLSHDGDRLALTARGRVFVAPRKQGRFLEAVRTQGVRYRDARFLPDGNALLVLSDESDEVEFWSVPANGLGEGEQLSDDGDILRWHGLPSPDGSRVAHTDKGQRLGILDVERKRNRFIDESAIDAFRNLVWSPDSRWLAAAETGPNLFRRINLYNMDADRAVTVTTDRYDSFSPAWGGGGEWLYFLSDRHLQSVVTSPWGTYQPEPFLDNRTEVYLLALKPGLKSPFTPADELMVEAGAKETDEGEDELEVIIEEKGIEGRIRRAPVPPGNYYQLMANGETLFWLSSPTGQDKADLQAMKITNENPKVVTVASGVDEVELSGDGKRLLIRKGNSFYVVDAAASSASLDDAQVDLSGWRLSVDPREEWRQMFDEAWRLERDYFYDRNLHGVDWPAMRNKYRPLVERVTDRAELADLIAQLVSELTALHIYVYGGEFRSGTDQVQVASLGAVLERADSDGGYRVKRIYRSEPDEPEVAAPLLRIPEPVEDGAVIEAVNGVSSLSVPDIGVLLRGQSGRQVRLEVRDEGSRETRSVVVEPITWREERDLRYRDWEVSRRLRVEELGDGEIGYVHLRAMGGGNFTEWAKNYYPVFTRKGLIVDVRNNRGGNIESWILNRLIREAWHHWNQTVGAAPIWNMQYAFRGHVVVLCNERTASDGEIFAEGARRLGIGPVVGTRTWGGEIWLSSNNFLVDGGIATAAEYGVYGPEGEWLIENHGVDPDVVVDNPPYATFLGEDAQLNEAIRILKETIAREPVEDPVPPPFPDKSFRYPR